MKSNRFFLFVMMLFGTLSSFAEDVNAMMLHLASGKQVICMLDEKPVVTFGADELILTTHMNKVSYQSTDVVKFTYLRVDPTGVSQVGMAQNMFSFNENTLSIAGAEPDTQISVYNVDGVLVASAMTNKKGAVTVTLPAQSGKVYVVKSSIANFKITKP